MSFATLSLAPPGPLTPEPLSDQPDPLPHKLSDRDRDLIGTLEGHVHSVIMQAQDPGAVLGAYLPLYLIAVFGLTDDQKKPFFDCLTGMLQVHANRLHRPDIVQSVGDIAELIRADCDAILAPLRG